MRNSGITGNHCVTSLEPLEMRRLLAAFAMLTSGKLTIVGSPAAMGLDDTINVTSTSTKITANLNGKALSFTKSQVKKIVINEAGSFGSDTETVSASITLPCTLLGGFGADSLTAGSGNDSIYGDEGDDTMRGGAGNDTLDGGDQDDLFDGGAGIDTADYSKRTTPIFVSLDNIANDGTNNSTYPGHENVLSTIENVLTGSGNDVITGSSSANYISSGGGNDTVDGGGGNDSIDGGGGNDSLSGSAGNDTIHGGSGNDIVNGGSGNDSLFGEAGNDTLQAKDGVKDVLDGGSGTDKDIVDKVDSVINVP